MFKVGDKVRIVKSGVGGSNHGGRIGDEFTIAKAVDNPGHRIFYKTDLWDFYEHEIELINQSHVRTVTRKEIVSGVYGRVKTRIYKK